MENEQIKKFQILWKNRFGTEISCQEAQEKGTALLRLVSLIYKPITEKEFEELQNRRKETGDI